MFALTFLSLSIFIFISSPSLATSSTALQTANGTKPANNCTACIRCYHMWQPTLKSLKDSGVELIMRASNLGQYMTSDFMIDNIKASNEDPIRAKTTIKGNRISFDDLDEKIRIIGDYMLSNKQAQDRSNLLKHEFKFLVAYVNVSLVDFDQVALYLKELAERVLVSIKLVKFHAELANADRKGHLDDLKSMIVDLTDKTFLLGKIGTLDANVSNEFITLLQHLNMDYSDTTGSNFDEKEVVKRAILITDQIERGVEHYLSVGPMARADLTETGRLIYLTDEVISKAGESWVALESKARTIMQTIGSEATGDFPRLMLHNQAEVLSRSLNEMELSWKKARDEMLYLSSRSSSMKAVRVFNECKRILGKNLQASESGESNNQTTITADQEITQSHLDTVLDLQQQVEVVQDHLNIIINNGLLEANIKMDDQTSSLLAKTKAINADSERSIKAIKEQAVTFEQNLGMRSFEGGLDSLAPNVRRDLAHLGKRMARLEVDCALQRAADQQLIDGQVINMKALEMTNRRLLEQARGIGSLVS